MKFIKEFNPEEYNSLQTNQKINLIQKFSNELQNKLNLPNIQIEFDDFDNESIDGKFTYNPLKIYINNKFLTCTHSAIVYELVFTIAHENYHYYQFELIKKLINKEELNETEKENAYLFFICNLGQIFNSYNKRFKINIETELYESDLYDFNPKEITANKFAYQITDELGTLYPTNGYNRFITESLNKQKLKIRTDVYEGSNQIIKTIKYNISIFKSFFRHKNKRNALISNYLDIDINELNLYTDKFISTWKKNEKQYVRSLNNIYK